MTNDSVIDYLTEVSPDAVMFTNPSFDNSIIGTAEVGGETGVVYSLSKMIEEMSKEDNITQEEAMEFIDYNTLRTIPYIK